MRLHKNTRLTLQISTKPSSKITIMSINNVALIGATGNLGPAIHKALLENGFEVTILSREGSTSTDKIPAHPKQKIIKANFDNVDSLTSALQGVDAVVSNVTSTALLSQKKIIDASISAGVKRFLPSEFGSDMEVEANKKVLFNVPKHEIKDYLEEKSQAHPSFSYTSVSTGPFFDWCLAFGLFGDFKNHDMTIWDGGETKVSTTTLPSIGKAVVGVFRNLDATKNKTVRVADTAISQKEMIEIAKEIDGKEWTTKAGNTEEAYKAGLAEFSKPEPNFMLAVTNQLFRIIFSVEHEPDMSGRLDNEAVGLPLMTREQVKGVIKNALESSAA